MPAFTTNQRVIIDRVPHNSAHRGLVGQQGLILEYAGGVYVVALDTGGRVQVRPSALRPTRCPRCANRICICLICQECGQPFAARSTWHPHSTAIHTHGCRNCSICGPCYQSGRREHHWCATCGACRLPGTFQCVTCGASICCATQCCGGTCVRCCPEHGPAIEDYGCRNYPARVPAEAPYSPFLYLGVELEVEMAGSQRTVSRDTAARALKRAHGDKVILKHDGSLSYGFEIVSGPFSLEHHQAIWGQICRDATRAGCRSWNHQTTGLHVHLSRAWFDTETLARFVTFINSDDTRQAIVQLAGRESPRYAALIKKTLANALDSQDRYEAVNLCNHSTVEVRIFKGTLKASHVLADIEFCHAAAYWAKQVDNEHAESWRNFLIYCQAHAAQYPHLLDFYHANPQQVMPAVVEE